MLWLILWERKRVKIPRWSNILHTVMYYELANASKDNFLEAHKTLSYLDYDEDSSPSMWIKNELLDNDIEITGYSLKIQHETVSKSSTERERVFKCNRRGYRRVTHKLRARKALGTKSKTSKQNWKTTTF